MWLIGIRLPLALRDYVDIFRAAWLIQRVCIQFYESLILDAWCLSNPQCG